MDPLATALTSIRLTSPLLARLTLGDDLALSMRGTGLLTGAIPFHYLLSGSCRLNTGDGAIDLSAGDIVMLPAAPAYLLETGGAGHRLEIVDLVHHSRQPLWSLDEGLDSPLVLHAGAGPQVAQMISGMFTVDGGQGRLTLKNLPGCIHMRDVGAALGGLMQAALDLVAAEGGARPGFAATSSRLLETILLESLRIWILGREHDPGILRGLMNPAIAPLLRAIYRDPGRGWTIAAMARTCGQSRSAFARHFRAALNVPPVAFVIGVRCERAEWLLLNTDLPVAGLASTLGYRSAFAFSRIFRQQRGLTPAAFRRRGRGCPDPAPIARP